MTDSAADPANSDTETVEAKPKGPLHELLELVKTIVYALLIALVLRVALFQPFTIPSASMEPTLMIGDYIIVSKYAYGWSKHSFPVMLTPPTSGRLLEKVPARGDIIVFKTPRDNKTDFIKRIIGLPGDTIQVTRGVVSINGAPVQREQMSPIQEESAFGVPHQVDRYRETLPGSGKTFVTYSFGADGEADNTVAYKVPPGHYFMMGDNRDNSLDSRFTTDQGGVGFVPAENLVGRAEIILFSWREGASLLKPWTWVTDAQPARFGQRLK
jgi:signal peptidase I